MNKNLIFIILVSCSSFSLNSEILSPQEAFFKAVNNDDIESLKKAIADGADINKINPETGTTALYKILLKIDEYTDKKNKWVLPTAFSFVSGLFALVGLTLIIETNDKLNKALKTNPRPSKIIVNNKSISLSQARADLTNFPILVSVLGATSIYLAYSAHIMRIRLGKAAKIANMLITNPKIKIGDVTNKLLKKIIYKSSLNISSLLRTKK